MPPQIITYPAINGHRYSSASVEAVWNGQSFRGFKSLNYSDELMPADVYGAAPQKLGRTRGKQNATCSFVMYKEEFENFRLSLGAGGVGFGELIFNISVTIFEAGQIPVTDLIEGVRVTKATDDINTDSADALTVSCETNVLRILRGVTGMVALPFPIP